MGVPRDGRNRPRPLSVATSKIQFVCRVLENEDEVGERCAAVNHDVLFIARDGLQNLRITEAIAEAARTGKIVDTTPA
jgi:hypothetical protein